MLRLFPCYRKLRRRNPSQYCRYQQPNQTSQIQPKNIRFEKNQYLLFIYKVVISVRLSQ